MVPREVMQVVEIKAGKVLVALRQLLKVILPDHAHGATKRGLHEKLSKNTQERKERH